MDLDFLQCQSDSQSGIFMYHLKITWVTWISCSWYPIPISLRRMEDQSITHLAFYPLSLHYSPQMLSSPRFNPSSCICLKPYLTTSHNIQILSNLLSNFIPFNLNYHAEFPQLNPLPFFLCYSCLTYVSNTHHADSCLCSFSHDVLPVWTILSIFISPGCEI